MPIEMPGVGLVYSLKEIVATLAVSKTTVLRCYREGALPGVRFGRSLMFTSEAVKKFLEGNGPRRGMVKKKRVTPTTPKGAPPTEADLNRQHEAREITRAMEQAGNNRHKACVAMGYSEAKLRRRIIALNLTFPGTKKRRNTVRKTDHAQNPANPHQI